MASIPPDPPGDDPDDDADEPEGAEDPAREAREEDAAGQAPGESAPPDPDEGEAAVRELLGRSDTRARVKAVIVRVSKARVAGDVLEDLARDALERAEQKARTLRSPERAWGWLSTIAGNRAKQWIRTDARRRRAGGVGAPRRVPLEAAEAVPAPAPESEPWSLLEWLKARIRPREQATLALLLEQAKSGKTLAEIAEARGTSPNAAYKKVGYLKKKYAAQLEAERQSGAEPRRSLLWAWLLAALAVGTLLALWRWLAPPARPEPPRLLAPTPTAPAPLPTTTATFEPAEPTPVPALPDVPAKPGR